MAHYLALSEGAGLADLACGAGPRKTEAFCEAYRILRPGGRLAVSAFEVDPERVAGIPVLGVDPVPDCCSLLETAGFAIDSYNQSAG